MKLLLYNFLCIYFVLLAGCRRDKICQRPEINLVFVCDSIEEDALESGFFKIRLLSSSACPVLFSDRQRQREILEEIREGEEFLFTYEDGRTDTVFYAVSKRTSGHIEAVIETDPDVKLCCDGDSTGMEFELNNQEIHSFPVVLKKGISVFSCTVSVPAGPQNPKRERVSDFGRVGNGKRTNR